MSEARKQKDKAEQNEEQSDPRRIKGEGCIYERDGKFQGRITIKGKKYFATRATRPEIIKWFDEIKEKTRGGRPVVSNRASITFLELARAYKVKRMGGWRPGTFDHYRCHVEKTLVDRFGRQRITSITSDEIEEFLNTKATSPRLSKSKEKVPLKPVKASTVNKLHSWLCWLFNHAIERGWVAVSPMARVDPIPEPKDEQYRPRVFKLKEIRAFLSACLPEYMNFFIILFFCGLRRDEIFRLRWEWVDLEDNILNAHGKTSVEDAIPLAKPAREAFLALGPQKEGLIFPGRYRKDAETTPDKKMTNRRKAIDSTLKRAGIDPAGVGMHTFRRSFITLLEKVGTRYGVVRLLGRHGRRGNDVTLRYLLPDEEEQRAALARLSAAVFPPDEQGPASSEKSPNNNNLAGE